MSSDAVGLDRISRIVGYKITKGDFSTTTPNLPQRLAILGEANDANQLTLDLNPQQITSAQQAGELYGYGSPIHAMARILFPVSGDGVGGIPVLVYPQAAAPGATAKIMRVAPSGVANGNGTHTLVIAGRKGVDYIFYDINIATGDDAADINDKIADAVNAVLGSPVSAVSDDYHSDLTSKWKGLSANQITVSVDTGNDDLGITYVITQQAAGAATPSIAAALALFGSEWNTIVVNGYGTVTSILDALEDFNGIALDNPTGRYAGIIMKPFIAITGSTANDPTGITYARKEYPDYHEQLTTIFAAAKKRPHILEEHESVSSLIASVEAGAGVAVVSESIRCVAGPRLRLLPLSPAPENLVVGAAWPRAGLNAVAGRFLALAKENSTQP